MKVTSSEKCETRSALELQKALDKFKLNYQLFVRNNKQYINVEEALDDAFLSPHGPVNIRDTAEIIRQKLWTTMTTSQTNKESQSSKWTTKIGQFVTKLYPVAKLASGLTASVAEVCSSSGLP